MLHTSSQIKQIKILFDGMKFCFFLLMFMFISIYLYANKHTHDTPHNFWLVIIISAIVIFSLGYLYYIAKLARKLDGNPIAWVVPTVIFGPLGLLVSYIVISSSVIRLQRQHIVDLKQEEKEDK